MMGICKSPRVNQTPWMPPEKTHDLPSLITPSHVCKGINNSKDKSNSRMTDLPKAKIRLPPFRCHKYSSFSSHYVSPVCPFGKR